MFVTQQALFFFKSVTFVWSPVVVQNYYLLSKNHQLMSIPKKIIDFCVYSSLVVSIGCGVLSFGFITILGISHAFDYALLSFFGTFIIYNLQRLIKLQSVTSGITNHLSWVKKNMKFLLLTMALCAMASLITTVKIIHWNVSTIVLILISLALSVAYAYKINGKNLREIPFLKIHLIALVWVVVVAFFPLWNEGDTNINHWLFGSIHYIYIIAICIPFDIRDLKFDANSQLTIPQLVGIKKAKIVGYLCLHIFLVLAIYLQPQLIYNPLFYSALLIQLALIYFTTENRPDFYFGGWIDGVIVLLGLSYLL